MAAKPRVFERTPVLSQGASQRLVSAVQNNRLSESRQNDLTKYAQLAQQAFVKGGDYSK